jgi:MFS family permease
MTARTENPAVRHSQPGAARESWLARRIPRLLAETNFRRYWAAQSISMLGDQVSGIAIPLAAVLVLHGTALEMGYLTALEWVPSLLFGLHAGAFVDRMGKRRATMVAADLGRFVLLASLPVCYLLGVLTLTQLLIVTFLAGTLSVLFNVSNATLFVSLLSCEQYLEGNSLIYGSRALSYVGGPSIGGVLVQVLSAPMAVLADALSFLGSAFFLTRTRTQEPPRSTEKGSVTAGARFIRSSPIVRSSLMAVAVINFFNLMFMAIYLLYAVRQLHIRPGELGVILGAAAIGGVAGAAATKRVCAAIGVGWAYALGCLLFTAPFALVPLASGPRPLILGMLFAAEFVSGFGVMVLDISIGSIKAAVVPPELRARVSGAFQAVNYGTRPLGALIGGLLGTTIGLRPTIWITVFGGVLGALLLLPGPVPRFRMPSGDAPAAQPGD